MSYQFLFGRGHYDRINKRKIISEIEVESSPTQTQDYPFETSDMPDCFDIGSLTDSGEETTAFFEENNSAPIEDPISIEIDTAIDYNKSNFTDYLRAAKLIQGDLDLNVRNLIMSWTFI